VAEQQEKLVSREASVNQFCLAWVSDYLKLKNSSLSPDEQPPVQPAAGP